MSAPLRDSLLPRRPSSELADEHDVGSPVLSPGTHQSFDPDLPSPSEGSLGGAGSPAQPVHTLPGAGSKHPSDPSFLLTEGSETSANPVPSSRSRPRKQAARNGNPSYSVEKQAITDHPLFPLLSCLMRICEEATRVPVQFSEERFNTEIFTYIGKNVNDSVKKLTFSEDNELDNLMIKAIQVLRIHVLELEKVTELCHDFCDRYISCLQGKMNSKTLLHSSSSSDQGDQGCDSSDDGDSDDLLSMEGPNSPPSSAALTSPLSAAGLSGQLAGVPGAAGLLPGMVPGAARTPHKTFEEELLGLQASGVSPMAAAAAAAAVLQRHQPTVSMPSQLHGFHPLVPGTTPLSQIGLYPGPLSHDLLKTLSTSTSRMTSATSGGLGSGPPCASLGCTPQHHSELCNATRQDSSKRPGQQDQHDRSFLAHRQGKLRFIDQKRGVLPKQATQTMKSWLFQHIVHPYPTEDEKRQIARETNLTLLQVNNWFINARRRILQPMMESKNAELGKTKRNKTISKQMERFWPQSLSDLPSTSKAAPSDYDVSPGSLPVLPPPSSSSAPVAGDLKLMEDCGAGDGHTDSAKLAAHDS